MAATAKDREEFAHIMGKEAPDMPYVEVRRLLKLATTLERLAVKACNEPMSQEDIHNQERKWALVNKLCRRYECGALRSDDPRGAIVKVTVPSGRTNDWGQEGICVPA